MSSWLVQLGRSSRILPPACALGLDNRGRVAACSDNTTGRVGGLRMGGFWCVRIVHSNHSHLKFSHATTKQGGSHSPARGGHTAPRSRSGLRRRARPFSSETWTQALRSGWQRISAAPGAGRDPLLSTSTSEPNWKAALDGIRKAEGGLTFSSTMPGSPANSHHRHAHGGFRGHHGSECAGGLPRDQALPAFDERAGRRRHREHLLDLRPRGAQVHQRDLYHLQGKRDSPDEERGGPVCEDNIRCNSIHPGTVDTPMVAAVIQDPEKKRNAWTRFPSGDSPPPWTSPTQPSSSPPTRPASSPAWRCPWMAG